MPPLPHDADGAARVGGTHGLAVNQSDAARYLAPSMALAGRRGAIGSARRSAAIGRARAVTPPATASPLPAIRAAATVRVAKVPGQRARGGAARRQQRRRPWASGRPRRRPDGLRP